MAWTSPKTWSANATLTAAELNTHIRDNERWLSGNATGGKETVMVTRSADQAGMSSGANIAFATESWDTGMHSVVTNTDRLVVPSGGAGVYQVGFCVRYDATFSSGTAFVAVSIDKNDSGSFLVQERQEFTASRTQTVAGATLVDLAVADYVTLQVTHSGCSNVDVKYVANFSPRFYAMWVAETR